MQACPNLPIAFKVPKCSRIIIYETIIHRSNINIIVVKPWYIHIKIDAVDIQMYWYNDGTLLEFKTKSKNPWSFIKYIVPLNHRKTFCLIK